jgi:acetyl-CoA carboxylase biotin carboxylase subunit
VIATLLIANRGEIACRIIRTAKRMGIRSVAVYSDADRDALHVRMADKAVRIGGPAPADSYLHAEAIISAAQASGADAIHPGYGFLSENAAFAQACIDAGLVFVGPPAGAIHAMGDKSRAKALMREAGVPVVPGYDGEDQSTERLADEAARIGFPVLVKAAAGGGGRGMRRINGLGDIRAAIDSARREAESAFGDATLLLEKLVTDARHIEVQIFADGRGNIVHLGERDCSTQRRHQKIIEETPSPFVDDAMRAAMGQAAIAAAGAVGYVGAGTVEFIVGADRGFHFLEMNTRLQVEHPVTEMVTGIDLVEWQLRVASGEILPLRQDEIRFSGHAIEARLCAEDAYAGFTPQMGTVLHWRPEAVAGEGIRIDHGLVEGGEISPHYDPMIAKVIAHGATRADAIAKLRVALHAVPLFGVVTNRGFLLDLLRDEPFTAGAMTTGLIDGRAASGALADALPAPGETDFALAAAVAALADGSDWFSSTGVARCPVTLCAGDDIRQCLVRFERGALVSIDVAGSLVALDVEAVPLPEVLYRVEGVRRAATVVREGRRWWVDRDGATFAFDEPDALVGKAQTLDETVVASPVSGLLRHVAVAEGDAVARGDLIAVIEAMKMETSLTARCDGSVGSLRVRPGEQVRAGDIVAEIIPTQ